MIVRALPKVYDPLIRLWVLRSLVILGGHKALIESAGVRDDEVANFVGLGRFRRMPKCDPLEIRAALWVRHEEAEKNAAKLPTDTVLAQNITWLSKTLGLDKASQAILTLCVCQAHHMVLSRALSLLGNLSAPALYTVFAKLLQLTPNAVRQAMHPSGPLSATGLVTFSTHSRWDFENKIEMLSGLADQLTVKQSSRMRILERFFVEAGRAELGPDAFAHVQEDFGFLKDYLAEVLKSRRKGVNVLIYGVPGSGKTQFTRTLAEAIGSELYEVATQDEDAEPLEGQARFRSYQLSQAVLAGGSNRMVLFDEIEDVFRPRDEDRFGRQNNGSGIKGWVNRTLEENPVPTIWVTNSRWVLDPAVIRRFDYVLELEVPPRSIRSRVIDRCLGDLPISPQVKERIAAHERLAPALINRAAKVVRHLREVHPGTDPGKALSRILGNTLEALGEERESRVYPNSVTAYRPEVLNTDCDLERLRDGLTTHGQGRLCLYGPPGTGKTAFGRYLSEVMDRPLLVKRASDLQSMWAGQTEKNIAKMFQEAAIEKAILLLDEADSFLRERRGAQQSWQVSEVNEMLTQMESFGGIFIASTNLMDSLDEASLRRFDLKIHFDYLKPNQAWVLFGDTAARLGFVSSDRVRASLSTLGNLTPGDFATVIRQARLRSIKTQEELLERLRAECEAKPGSRRKAIGF